MKNKKRSNGEIGSSPKRPGDSISSSPRVSERSPKRLRQNEEKVNQSNEVKSPREKRKGQVVNGAAGSFESIDTPTTEVSKLKGEGDGASKSPRKKLNKVNGSTENSGKSTNGVKPVTNGASAGYDISTLFSEHDRLLPGAKRTSLVESYASSKPYNHIVIPNLMNPELLSSVRDEILTHLHFTPKQTDIYSVSQTGDLANLTGLPSSELESLPSLLKLRNALYSQEFRDFLCSVTGVKHLSGTKTDMSINSYEKGGYLLTHDDVIGTRSVSFILYLVQGNVEGGWKDDWGGGLRLYKTSENGVPENEPCLTIPPKWNQMAMFAVQPGKSFHDVEEVYTSEHSRLAISGWFHVPQEGEPGYVKADTSVEERALSSLEQLTSIAEDNVWSYMPIPDEVDYEFSEEDLAFLQKWINEVYLTPDVVEQMHEAMTDESFLELPDFLNADVAKSIHQHLSVQDRSSNNDWEVAGPPHKQRFQYTRKTLTPEHNIVELLEHPAFRKWLYHATGLEVSSQRTVARHFRPGSDYTLATEHSSPSPNLEATLCLTPSALKPKPPKAKGISARAVLSAKETGWTTGEFGGYEVYLAPSGDEEADPAVYKASEGDDGVLVSTDAGWNVFTLVLRDTGVLKFVKYVSRAAWGGRWDVTSEWTVNDTNDDEELEEEEEWMGIPSQQS